jgi:hypothetical protein
MILLTGSALGRGGPVLREVVPGPIGPPVAHYTDASCHNGAAKFVVAGTRRWLGHSPSQ